LSNWSAFFGTSFFGAPNFNPARVLLLDEKGSIHEGCEWKRGIARRRARSTIFGAPNLHSARVLFLDDKGSIHEGTRRLRMEKEYRSKKGSKRRFWERRHLCRHGFYYSMIKENDTKTSNVMTTPACGDGHPSIEGNYMV